MIDTSKGRRATLSTIAAVFLAVPVWAQDADIINFGEMTCRTYLMLGGDERDMTTLFIHGYFAGQADVKSVIISDLAAASEQVLADCIDGPEQVLLEAFARVLK